MLVLRRQWSILFYMRRSLRGLGLAPFWEDRLMSSEVPIEIEDKPTAANNPQQSWGFEGEPPEAVIKDFGTRDGTS